MLDAFDRAMSSGIDLEDVRAGLIARYGFGIPTEPALDAITRCSPGGVVEIGAGTGYWAHLLHQRGVDIVAYDRDPPPSPRNRWFAGTEPWHAVQRGDHDDAARHPDRTLLLVWPTRNEIWAAAAVERYHDAGGASVVHVGEGPGGHTGDDVFHALLGELDTCTQCDYGVATAPCVCGVEARWRRTGTIALPHWPGCHDDAHLYTRRPPQRTWSRWWADAVRRGFAGRRRRPCR